MRNADSFDAFYAESVLRVTSQLYPMTCDRAEAQASVREAYARAWQGWSPVSRRGDREALVRFVAFRITTNVWRRRAGSHPDLAGELPGGNADRFAVIGALRQIQAVERQAVVLHHLLGKSTDQVAGESRVPVGTARARLSRGERALARLLPDLQGAGPEYLGPLLREAADDLVATSTPSPVGQVRQHGDYRRRNNMLVVVLSVAVLVGCGSLVFALAG